jgi:hypothetical protein
MTLLQTKKLAVFDEDLCQDVKRSQGDQIYGTPHSCPLVFVQVRAAASSHGAIAKHSFSESPFHILTAFNHIESGGERWWLVAHTYISTMQTSPKEEESLLGVKYYHNHAQCTRKLVFRNQTTVV